jgi:hypothetical protein
MKLENKNIEEFDIDQVKVDRTLEGTIMEALAVLLLAATWVIGLMKHQSASATGEGLLAKCIVFSIIVVLLLVASYFPKFFSNSHQLSNMRQVLLSVRMIRVLAIEFALTVLFMVISGGLMSPQYDCSWVFNIIIIVMLLTALLFTLLIYKAK